MKKKSIILFLLSVGIFLSYVSFFPKIEFLKYHLLILILIGIVSSFVGTLAGGGGLITLPAMMFVGIPIQTSIATNKFSSGIAAFSSVFYLVFNKHLSAIDIMKNLFVACIGGTAGALFTANISEQNMNIIAFIFLFIALVVTVKNKKWLETLQTKEKVPSNKIWQLLLPFFIACYDGGFGPGSSTFGILYYIKKHHTYIKAVQLTRVLIFGSCTGGFIIYYQTGFLQWPYAIAMAFGSIIGSQIGLIVLPKLSLKIAKTLLITILCLLIGQMILKII
ncbi:sulfite exporter TauE/SafE family protein [Cytobacillus dafuensis]|uniref:Probable membrane transporter protein n=1 Tax=Cytobacillus dafuensis TaxID=1742359 RepID=A0A5B8ZBM0_CYTDA|nr:sulfite exporter TauE/SafE family protein [Cytobacillus dafuensis]QED48876.1 sulfite exporter TauE/SafE family protein [Cytobacillus dafuensis]